MEGGEQNNRNVMEVVQEKQQKGGRGGGWKTIRNVVEVVVQGNNRNVVSVAVEKP